MSEDTMSVPAQKPPRRWLTVRNGCGCAVIVFLLGVVACVAGVWYVYNLVNSKIIQDKPLDLPPIEYQSWEADVIRAKVQAHGAGKSNRLVLTDRELCVLLHAEADEQFKKLEAFDITFDGDTARVRASAPHDAGGGETRYINVDVTANLGVDEGALSGDVHDLRVGVVDLVRFLGREKLSQELRDRINADPRAREGLKKIKSLRIEDGRAVIELEPGALKE